MSVQIEFGGASLSFPHGGSAASLVAPFGSAVGLIAGAGGAVFVGEQVPPPGVYKPLFAGSPPPAAAPSGETQAAATSGETAQGAGDASSKDGEKEAGQEETAEKEAAAAAEEDGEEEEEEEEDVTVFAEDEANPFDDMRSPSAPPRPLGKPDAAAVAAASPPAVPPRQVFTPDPGVRARVIAFYRQHNPAKLSDPSFDVNATLKAYEGREKRLFEDLNRKYFGDPAGPPAAGSAAAAAASARQSTPRNYDTPANRAVPKVVDGLKAMYRMKIRPIEEQFKFGEFHSPMLTDTDIEAKPMVLLIGQYSTGKTTFIKYLLEREFPGQRIGPEPTTDRFVAVMHGADERVTPGNAAAVRADMPFSALQTHGMDFLNKFEVAQCPCPILDKITFIDTPGVLSGEKQRIGRSYSFPHVIEWFAERADRILLLFDAHKLDISDEFKSAIEVLKGHDDKVRVVLNKADMISGQQLMRVYGALMWSLGKVLSTPEVLRVYIGSFWDRPYQNTENTALFEAESADLLSDLRSLPRNSAVRKVNELVKRARMAKVHAYLVSHLRGQFGIFGKEKTKRRILDKLAEEFRAVQMQYDLPKGDFPNLRRFREWLERYEIHKFPKLDPRLISALDDVLGRDIPRLMQQMPGYREAVDDFQHGKNVNPFDDANQSIRARPQEAMAISAAQLTKYENIFRSLALTADGRASGATVREVLVRSGLGSGQLRRVWALSDMDKDNFLDSDEFAVAMYLVDALTSRAIDAPPDRLPATLVPPSKRHLATY